MGEDPLDGEVGERGDLADDLECLLVQGAAPSHSRVHLDVERRPDACLAGPFLKFPRKTQIGNRGDQVVFDDLVDLGIRGGGEDDHGGCDFAYPELNPFIGVRHTQAGGAVLQGDVGDLDGPVAVSVRLDHLHDLNVWADQPLHLFPVRGEIAEIDLDPAAVFLIFF